MKIGVHGRNAFNWREVDFAAVKKSGVTMLKMMSISEPDVFRRLWHENPGIDFITRLYHPSFNTGGHPSPVDFVQLMLPVMERIAPYCTKFEIHNEPNHRDRIEGWGATDEDALDFRNWFGEVYLRFNELRPDFLYGFPGLAVPEFAHRDLSWLEICRPAINKADFLCLHSYWQNFGTARTNHLSPAWGLNCEMYHQRFPDKILHITEAGNSNKQSGHELKDEVMAAELVEWFEVLSEKYDYVGSACPFLLSSPDPTWSEQGFTWVDENERVKPVVYAISDITE